MLIARKINEFQDKEEADDPGKPVDLARASREEFDQAIGDVADGDSCGDAKGKRNEDKCCKGGNPFCWISPLETADEAQHQPANDEKSRSSREEGDRAGERGKKERD